MTGRTHQIRATLSKEGFPVAGDRKYGARLSVRGGQLLCAASLTFHAQTERLAPLSGRTFVSSYAQQIRATII